MKVQKLDSIENDEDAKTSLENDKDDDTSLQVHLSASSHGMYEIWNTPFVLETALNTMIQIIAIGKLQRLCPCKNIFVRRWRPYCTNLFLALSFCQGCEWRMNTKIRHLQTDGLILMGWNWFLVSWKKMTEVYNQVNEEDGKVGQTTGNDTAVTKVAAASAEKRLMEQSRKS